MDEEIRVDEIVGLLRSANPDVLKALQAEFPTQKELFASGRILGVQADVALASARRAIDGIIPWTERVSVLARQRIESARRLDLIGQCVALVGTFGAVIFASSGASPNKILFVAATALAGNACVAVAHYYRGDLLGDKPGLTKAYAVLLSAVPELQFVQAQIEEWVLRGTAELPDKKAMALVTRANKLCGAVHRAGNAVPGSRHLSSVPRPGLQAA